MRNISNKIGKLLMYVALPLGGAVAGGLSSCDAVNEFLEVKPLSEISVENYWDEKADVVSVVMGCYSGLQTSDFMQRVFVWGDCRSDDVIYSKSGNNNNLQQVIEENILETNTFVNWSSMYQVINRCNTVIYYAPIVAEKDPNYTDSEMRANIAEATWIRSLCYFYLARTFRDVPYTTKPSMDDNDIEGDYRIAPTPFKTLLANIARDLEAVREDAIRFYPPMQSNNTKISNPYNTSRVTVCTMNALLADVYLWLGEYQKCIDCTQRVFDYKLEVYKEVKEEKPNSVRDIKFMEGEKYPLIMEMTSGSSTAGNAFTTIFGEGNSFESIFELYFDQSTSNSNPLRSWFLNDQNNGICNAYSKNAESVYSNGNKLFKYTDNRVIEYFDLSNENLVPISKFSYRRLSYTPLTTTGSAPTASTSSQGSYANWIVYRLTDVMLMRAEALVELGSEENLLEAFDLISAVYNRSNNLEKGDAKGLSSESAKTQEDMRALVRDERHRELMFEGKRWFDLVRYALRDGSNDELLQLVTAKQTKNTSKIIIQLKQRDALFWPYAEREIDLNPNLRQNSAYLTTETSQK